MPIRWNGKSQGRTYLQNIHVTKALDSKYTKCYKSIIRGRQNLKKMCTWFANEQVQEKLFSIIHWSLRKCKLKPWRCTTTHSPEKLKLKTSDGKIWNNWNPYEPHMGMLNYIKKKKMAVIQKDQEVIWLLSWRNDVEQSHNQSSVVQ